MILKEGDFQFVDYSTLIDLKKCPRRYFFHYVKRLVPDSTALALVFGSSWGSAMDALYAAIGEGITDRKTLLSISFGGFLERWTEDGLPAVIPPTDFDTYKARQPMTAMSMLSSYIDKRLNWLANVEIVAIELPFAVPVNPEKPWRYYIGRLDKVIRERVSHVAGRVKGIEHKTTSLFATKTGIQDQWVSSFDPNSQIDGYIHALSLIYGEEAGGVDVDGALVHKQHHDIFKIVPFSGMQAFINEFLTDLNYWWDRLEEANRENFYPRNDWGCQDRYGQCPFLSLCRMTPRTDRMPEEMPLGYKENTWVPYDTDIIRQALKNTNQPEPGALTFDGEAQ